MIRERCPVKVDALAQEGLGLMVQWQLIGVFVDEPCLWPGRRCGASLSGGVHPVRRQPARDRVIRRRCLDHAFLAGPAGIFGTDGNGHPDPGRIDVEPFGSAPANPLHVCAAGTGDGSGSTVTSSRGKCFGKAPRLFLRHGLAPLDLGRRRFGIFQRLVHLIRIEPFRAQAKTFAFEFLDGLFKGLRDRGQNRIGNQALCALPCSPAQSATELRLTINGRRSKRCSKRPDGKEIFGPARAPQIGQCPNVRLKPR